MADYASTLRATLQFKTAGDYLAERIKEGLAAHLELQHPGATRAITVSPSRKGYAVVANFNDGSTYEIEVPAIDVLDYLNGLKTGN